MPVSAMRVSRADRTLTRKARSRRDAVLEAAVEVVSRRGFHETSIADIAGCARVSRATIYQYFRDKREIFRVLTDRVAQRIIGAIDAWGPLPRAPWGGAAAADPSRALVEQLRSMVEARIAQVFAAVSANADAARLVLLLSRPNDSPVDEATRRIDDHVVGILARELQLTSGYGWTRSCDPELIARFLVGGIKELLIQALDHAGRSPQPDATAVEREIGALVLFGLAHHDLLASVVHGPQAAPEKGGSVFETT